MKPDVLLCKFSLYPRLKLAKMRVFVYPQFCSFGSYLSLDHIVFWDFGLAITFLAFDVDLMFFV